MPLKTGVERPIKATLAQALTVDELRHLVSFCDCQRETLWYGLDAQGILDVYHANVVWDGVEAAFAYGTEAGGEARAIRAAMNRSHDRVRDRADGIDPERGGFVASMKTLGITLAELRDVKRRLNVDVPLAARNMIRLARAGMCPVCANEIGHTVWCSRGGAPACDCSVGSGVHTTDCAISKYVFEKTRTE